LVVQNKEIEKKMLFLLLTKYSSGDQFEKNEMGGHVARMEKRRGVYRVSVRKPEGKSQFGRPRHKWENEIKMDLHEVGGMD
jgi:hypothetical protein